MLHTGKSHDHGSKFVGGEAFLVKNDLFDPSDPYMTFDPLLVMWHNSSKVKVIVTKFGRNQSRNVEVISHRSVARRRRRRRRRRKKHKENNTLPPKAARYQYRFQIKKTFETLNKISGWIWKSPCNWDWLWGVVGLHQKVNPFSETCECNLF